MKHSAAILAWARIVGVRLWRASPRTGLSLPLELTENDGVRAPIPDLSLPDFARRLQDELPEPLPAAGVDRLYLHYQELRRWNRRLSLIGPSEGERLVQRHYVESLAALALLEPRDRVLVDLGTGAGFPGLVLACARPALRVVLIESNQRKWSFLKTVCRKAALSCDCLNARVGAAPVHGLPPQIDVITSRAVRIEELGLEALLGSLAAAGRILLWRGASAAEGLPAGLVLERQAVLPGGQFRRILEFRPRAGPPSSR